MKLKTLWPYAFGKFHLEAPIQLGDGLNIIRGENEAGKSTLGAFVLGMFYGFKKEGKTRISRSQEFDRYKPWSGSDYRGSLTYEEGDRVYRVERSFEPDSVRVFDDATGEDITRAFSQDSRKEYDFAQRHLGLSQKEFRNTIWIGQLGSSQEPGLGTEIQGKLESILQGGAEDVSLGRALASLGEERAKLKSPRSSKARLDLLGREIEGLLRELGAARAAEEQVREDMAEAAGLTRERGTLQLAVAQGEKDIRVARYSLLQGILSRVQEFEAQASSVREKLRAVDWAKDMDPGCEELFRTVRGERDTLTKRIAEIEEDARMVSERRKEVEARLESLAEVQSIGMDEPGLASLYPTRYSLAKAQAVKGERAANEARKDLRAIEEEGQAKGYPSGDLDADVLRQAEDYNETCLVAERAKGQLELEAEKARAAAAAASSGGASTVAYTLALVGLGVAVILLLMGVPASVPLFAVAVATFAFGLHKNREAARARRTALEALAQKEKAVSEQSTLIAGARKVLSDFLDVLGARSVDELRAYAREIASYRASLKAARDKFNQAQTAWFDASAEFSAVEKEVAEVLKASGTIRIGETVTEAAVASLRRSLRDLESRKRELSGLESRASEVRVSLEQQKNLLEKAWEKEKELCRACGSDSAEGLAERISASKEHREFSRTLREIEGREEALLSGRTQSDVQTEISVLSAEMGEAPLPVMEVSDKDFETMRAAQEQAKARLSDLNVKLAGLERGIRVRTETGRPSLAIEEELARKRDLEEALCREHEALSLAYETLCELSASVRREFAPALNSRVGEILEGITSGRYTQIKVSPDLEMSVIHPDAGMQVPASLLSGGTLDQCYFALRVAIAEAVTKKDEFPFFLDDSFVQYDDSRLAGALFILGRLAERHQILVLSCHGREEEAARKLGLAYRRVAL